MQTYLHNNLPFHIPVLDLFGPLENSSCVWQTVAVCRNLFLYRATMKAVIVCTWWRWRLFTAELLVTDHQPKLKTHTLSDGNRGSHRATWGEKHCVNKRLPDCPDFLLNNFTEPCFHILGRVCTGDNACWTLTVERVGGHESIIDSYTRIVRYLYIFVLKLAQLRVVVTNRCKQ